MEGVEPSWPKPPVSETGASTSFRHIRTRSRAGSAARRDLRSLRRLRLRACDVEPSLAARLELHDLRRARRCGTHRPHPVEMTMHLLSSSRWWLTPVTPRRARADRCTRAARISSAAPRSRADPPGFEPGPARLELAMLLLTPQVYERTGASLRQDSNLRFNRTKGACC